MQHIYILSCEKDGGIYHYLFEAGNISFVDKTQLDRPMYAIIRGNKMHVVLREIDTKTHFGGLLSFDIADSGNLVNPTEISHTNGIVPCHLEVIGDDTFVVNYLSGNIVKRGKKIVTHKGKSVHPTRQEAPHTHFVVAIPNEEHIVCTDLGLDKIFVYTKDLVKISEAKVPAGCGPRHIAFSEDGDYAFVACELSSTVALFRCTKGNLTYIDSFCCLPDGFQGQSTVAAIRRKDRNLYVSNRGHDSISVFRFEKGALTLTECVKCYGKSPRDINIVDDYIFAANELSNNVTAFKMHSDGTLQKKDLEIAVPSPVCILSN